MTDAAIVQDQPKPTLYRASPMQEMLNLAGRAHVIGMNHRFEQRVRRLDAVGFEAQQVEKAARPFHLPGFEVAKPNPDGSLFFDESHGVAGAILSAKQNQHCTFNRKRSSHMALFNARPDGSLKSELEMVASSAQR